MASKKKDGRRKHGKVDPVRVQVSIRIARVPGLRERLTNRILNQIVRDFVDTGKTPRGIKITAINWINPVRKDPTLARWKSSSDSNQSMTQARATLRRVLRRVRFNFQGFR